MATAINGVIPAGARAPAFALPLIGGGEAALPDRAAKGLALAVFFKDSCPTCRLALPFVERLHRFVAPAGARVLAVSQDGMEKAQAFARDLGLTMPIAVDRAGWPVSREYDLVFVPTFYLMERDGTIVRSQTGFSKEDLQRVAADLAASVGAPSPALYGEDEQVPLFKPG